MSSDWPLKYLAQIADEVTVGYVGPMASEYVESGVPFLRSLNIEPFGVNTNDIKFITPQFHRRIKKSALRPGDVAIVRTGKPGSCAVIPDWLEDANCSDLVLVKCGPEIRPRFLCYWVNSVASHHISSHTVGAVQQHFNVGAAKIMKVAVPSLQIQDEVIAVLGGLDDRITLLRETNATLEAIAQALFKSWFVDFDPVRAKMEGRAPEGMDEVTAALFPDEFDESELGLVPRGWRVGALTQISKISSGNRPNVRSDAMTGAAPIQLFGGAGIMGFTNESLFQVRKILTGRVGTLGKVHIAYPPFWASDNVLVLSPEENRSFHFCLHWLKSIDVHSLNRGSTQPLLTQKDLGKQQHVIPTKAVLCMFATTAEVIYEAIRENAEQAQTLASLRDTLLPRLISGQLRLPEAEALLEEACV